MTYSVGKSMVVNYANTSSGKVTNVVADNGVGGLGEAVTANADRVSLSFTVATNIQFLTIDVTSLSGYIAGKSDVTITVNPNVYVYGTPPTLAYDQYGNPGVLPTNIPDASLIISGGSAGDTIKLINNGRIVGYGGDGGGVYKFGLCCGSPFLMSTLPSQGNSALSFVTPGITLSIENNGYIAGGGGGGGGLGGVSYNGSTPGGGGGAGGGISGIVGISQCASYSEPTIRAIPPNLGNYGKISYIQYGCCGCSYLSGKNGGGGGFVFPGVGGHYDEELDIANGGGAGGAGNVQTSSAYIFNNDGGSANNNAPTYTTRSDALQGGGGGGWGASGSAGYYFTSLYQLGKTGGNSIITNGNAYTLTGSGSLYGAVNTTRTSSVYTVPASASGLFLDVSGIPGFVNGNDVVIIVPANVVLRTFSIGYNAGVTTPSSVRLINNGFIYGAGGRGSAEGAINTVGGNALSVGVAGSFGTWAIPLIIENNGAIAGGGGGGAYSYNGGGSIVTATRVAYGGGGAGNGASGTIGSKALNPSPSFGTIGVGADGSVAVFGEITYSSGGAGGTITPGTFAYNTGTFAPGSYPGKGGQAGGAGAFYTPTTITFPLNSGNYGGGANNEGSGATIGGGNFGGGGGGWGSYGGNTNIQSGRAGGRAIKLISVSVTVYINGPGYLLGAVSY